MGSGEDKVKFMKYSSRFRVGIHQFRMGECANLSSQKI